jgi:hypothetical protein
MRSVASSQELFFGRNTLSSLAWSRLLPSPALGEGRHGLLAGGRIAVRQRTVNMREIAERPRPGTAQDPKCQRMTTSRCQRKRALLEAKFSSVSVSYAPAVRHDGQMSLARQDPSWNERSLLWLMDRLKPQERSR